MKISKRGEYALRAMISLGIASKVGRKLVQTTELAKVEDLPVKFLEQVIQQLREAGYVASQRGKHGGYRLAKPADKIVIGSVIRLIDGPLAPIACVSQTAYEPCKCPDEAHCGLRMLMLDVRNAITGILDRYTLAEVVEVTTRKMISDGLSLPYSASLIQLPALSPAKKSRLRNANPSEGIIHQLLGDYAI